MAIKIGGPAPDFTLYDSEKNKVSLSDFKGKNVVILFFPLAFTRVCTTELCSIRDNMADYNKSHAQILGISVDSLYVLKQFKQEQNLNFPLLSDFNKEASKAFDVLDNSFPPFDMHGVSKRAAFVLDKDGIIQYIEICGSASELPDLDKVQKVLTKLEQGF
ncbi:MAG: peroxiredoxin [Ferruginibacter sp.]